MMAALTTGTITSIPPVRCSSIGRSKCAMNDAEGDLIAIGYWRSDQEPDLPQPSRFVGAALPEDLRDQLCAYLDSGAEFMAFLGYSSCRFRCGVPHSAMGCRDLTDGTWIWPEGLSH